MAKVSKKVLLNGKWVEKELEEYAVFEFDQMGNMTAPESLESDKKYEDYDKDGFRNSLPGWSHFYNVQNENPPIHFEGKRGQVVHKLGYDNIWIWQDKKGRNVWEEMDLENWHFDCLGHLLPVYGSSWIYEYDRDNLVHIQKDNAEEAWFEYDNGLLIHEKVEEKRGTDKYRLREASYKYDADENLIQKKISDLDKTQKYFGLNEYDSKGNLIHEKNECVDDEGSYKWERWYGYDEDGKIITEISEDGKEKSSVWKYLYEYDANGNMISKKCVNEDGSDDGNSETVYEYDSNGRKIREKTYYSETIYEYDDAGRLIHEKCDCFRGHEYFYEYDKEGHLIHEKKDKGIHFENEDIDEKRWDDKGRLIFVKEGICGEKNMEWDNGGNLVYEKRNGIFNEEKRWNSNGRLIYKKTSYLEKWVDYDFDKELVRRYGTQDGGSFESVSNLSGQIITYKYGDAFLEFDSEGILAHYFDGSTDEWYEYEFYEDGSIKKKICLRKE